MDVISQFVQYEARFVVFSLFYKKGSYRSIETLKCRNDANTYLQTCALSMGKYSQSSLIYGHQRDKANCPYHRGRECLKFVGAFGPSGIVLIWTCLWERCKFVFISQSFAIFCLSLADEKVDNSMGNLLTNLTKYFYVAFCFCFFQTIYENLWSRIIQHMSCNVKSLDWGKLVHVWRCKITCIGNIF